MNLLLIIIIMVLEIKMGRLRENVEIEEYEDELGNKHIFIPGISWKHEKKDRIEVFLDDTTETAYFVLYTYLKHGREAFFHKLSYDEVR